MLRVLWLPVESHGPAAAMPFSDAPTVGVLVAAIILCLLMFRLTPAQSRPRRENSVNYQLSRTTTEALTAMCYVATARGNVDPADADFIGDALDEMFGERPLHGRVLDGLQRTVGARDIIDALGTTLSFQQRTEVMEAAIRMAAAYGPITQEAYDTLLDVTDQLDLRPQTVKEILRRLSGTLDGNGEMVLA